MSQKKEFQLKIFWIKLSSIIFCTHSYKYLKIKRIICIIIALFFDTLFDGLVITGHLKWLQNWHLVSHSTANLLVQR